MVTQSSAEDCLARLQRTFDVMKPERYVLHLEDMQPWTVQANWRRKSNNDDEVDRSEYHGYFLIYLTEVLASLIQSYPRFYVIIAATNMMMDAQIRVASEVDLC